MISVAQLKKNLTGRPEEIERMLRVLPDMIQREIDNPQVATPRVIKKLRAQLQMVQQLVKE